MLDDNDRAWLGILSSPEFFRSPARGSVNATVLCRGGLDFPADLSPAAVDLLKSLLHRDANERLGAGPLDAEEIKVCLSAFFPSCRQIRHMVEGRRHKLLY